VNGGDFVENDKIGETLSSLSPALKKEILHSLVAALLSDLTEEERIEFLQTVRTRREKSGELIEMVEH
jgi:hypothetical protein